MRVGSLIWRVVFVGCTAALLVATHWPGLAIKGPISRTDLVIHAGVFAAWTLLLGLTGWVRTRRLVLMGVCFAIFDETTQPMFSRVFDWWDLGADIAGVLMGAGVFSVLFVRTPRDGADA